jgi:hypothetical protein
MSIAQGATKRSGTSSKECRARRTSNGWLSNEWPPRYFRHSRKMKGLRFRKPLKFWRARQDSNPLVRSHELGRYSMATHPNAGEVQDDKMHDQDDGNESKHICSAWYAGGRSGAPCDDVAVGITVGALRWEGGSL